METIQSILYYVSAGVFILATILGLFTGKSKIKKVIKQQKEEDANNEAQTTEVVEVEDKSSTIVEKLSKIKLVLDKITSFMVDAESTGMVGKAKKIFVISSLIQECCKVGIDYNEIAQESEEKIESYIDFSKEVNSKEKVEEHVETTAGTDF